MKTEREKKLEAALQLIVENPWHATVYDTARKQAREALSVPENLPDFDDRKGPEENTDVVKRSVYTCPHCNNRVEVDSVPEPDGEKNDE